MASADRSLDMTRVDVAIVGAGKAGRSIAEKLAANNKNVLLIALPGGPEDYFRNLIGVLTNHPPSVPSSDFPTLLATAVPRFKDSKTLIVNEEEIQARNFVIASGCGPRVPQNFAGSSFSTPLNILSSPASDAACTIIGAGPVGVCTAAKLAKRGTKVKLIGSKARVLPKEDHEISTAVQTWLESLGVRIELNVTGGPGDGVVLATGLLPNISGMDLQKAGIYVTNDGRVAVDEEMRTPNLCVHAAGAVTGAVFNLAYEDYQAEVVAANIPAAFFNRQKLSPDPVPFLIPLETPVTRLGLTEEEAKAEKRGVISVTCAAGDWRVKLVGRKRNSELLGAHIFAPGADGLVLYFDLLMRAGIPLHEVNESQHFPSPGSADFAREAINLWLKNSN